MQYINIFYNRNVFFVLVLIVAFIIIANGVKAIAVSIMAFKMRREMNATSYSAIANALASIAARVTPTLIAKVIDSTGWTAAYMGAILQHKLFYTYPKSTEKKKKRLLNPEKITLPLHITNTHKSSQTTVCRRTKS